MQPKCLKTAYFNFLRHASYCDSCDKYLIDSCLRCDQKEYHTVVEEVEFEDDPDIWAMSLTRRCGEWKQCGLEWFLNSGYTKEHWEKTGKKNYRHSMNE